MLTAAAKQALGQHLACLSDEKNLTRGLNNRLSDESHPLLEGDHQVGRGGRKLTTLHDGATD